MPDARGALARPARIAALWFGVQTVWSAILGVFLQSRASALAPHDALALYGWLAGGGALLAGVVQVVAGVWSDRRVLTVGHRREFYLSGTATAIVALALFFAARDVAWFVVAVALLQIGMNVVAGPYQAAMPDAVPAGHDGRAAAWMSTLSFGGSVAGLAVAAALDLLAAGACLIAALAAGAAISLVHLRTLPPVVARRAAFRFDRNVAIVLCSRGLINVGFYTLFGFLFFFVGESLGVRDVRTTTGLLFIGFTVAGVGGAALAGAASDRRDKRVVIGVAALAIALAVGAFAAAPSLIVAACAAVAAGFAWGAFFTADWAIAYALLPRDAMAAAMGVWNLAAAIPQVVAPAVTAPLVALLDARARGSGPRVALALVAVEFVAGAALVWLIPRAAFGSDARKPADADG